ncbi:MAG: rRNA maturation RNase YbeY [Candidatus Hydrogenedentes bacterium]|nr:rRNA maturation RNase YbeY [Candidatus Hydrogenedentota bacterium]
MAIRNESTRRWLYRRDALQAIAGRIAEGEGLLPKRKKGLVQGLEVSLLFCDDAFIRELNRQYRDVDKPTDVLSFGQDGQSGAVTRSLGDIVISLETVERRNGSDRAAMRDEVQLLFCHGMLHLAGHDHRTRIERERMHHLQAVYLKRNLDAAWLSEQSYQPVTELA